MTKSLTQHTFKFVILIFVQIVILNNLNLNGYINPYIYPLFIILLPLNISHWAILLLGLFTGITVGIFTNTAGIHGAATVFLAFMRPYILRFLSPRASEDESEINLGTNNFGAYLLYISVCTLLHHIVFFYLEILNFSYPIYTLSKITFSTILSIFCMLIYSLILRAYYIKR